LTRHGNTHGARHDGVRRPDHDGRGPGGRFARGLAGLLAIGLLAAATTVIAPGWAHAEDLAPPWAASADDRLGETIALRQALDAPPGLNAQITLPASDGSIFQRFASGKDASKTWQTMFEVPVGLYPSSDPGSHIVANEGINWVTSYQPLNRIYFGRSIGYAHMEWEPGGRLATTTLVEWTWTEIVNFSVEPWWVISLGAGVGFMDGLTFFKAGGFVHRLEPFLPVQIGSGLRLGKSWFVEAKAAQSSYFGSGPVVSATRSLVGVGYNY
jgi:hypothetical protein